MIEWIVLVWLGVGSSGYHVSISSNPDTFKQAWENLTVSERGTARIFKGNEFEVNPILKIKQPNQKKYCTLHREAELEWKEERQCWVCPVSDVCKEPKQ